MPGPVPKKNAVNRNPKLANTVVLPSEGRLGDPPSWPLLMVEPAVWGDLWAMPQAVMWERMRSTRTVARYAFLLTLVENPSVDVNASVLSEVRQLEQQLGVTPKAMRDLRWEVAGDELAERREAVEVGQEKPRPQRRLKVAASAVEA